MIVDELKTREQRALQELAKLIKDKNAVPINYNHYYTENVHKTRGKRLGDQLEKHVPNTNRPGPAKCNLGQHYYQAQTDTKDELGRAISKWSDSVSADMEDFSCDEALDCLKAIYKVSSAGRPRDTSKHIWFSSRSIQLTSHQTGPNEGLRGQCDGSGH